MIYKLTNSELKINKECHVVNKKGEIQNPEFFGNGLLVKTLPNILESFLTHNSHFQLISEQPFLNLGMVLLVHRKCFQNIYKGSQFAKSIGFTQDLILIIVISISFITTLEKQVTLF